MTPGTVESILMKFLRLRQQECQNALEVVSVEQIGGGEENRCFLNALAQTQPGAVYIASGWLVLPFDKKLNQRQFTQHWWNYSAIQDKYLDFSPSIEDGAIYILDPDIGIYAAENNEKLTSCVPLSLLYRDGQFHSIGYAPGGFHSDRIDSLATDRLFAPFLV